MCVVLAKSLALNWTSLSLSAGGAEQCSKRRQEEVVPANDGKEEAVPANGDKEEAAPEAERSGNESESAMQD